MRTQHIIGVGNMIGDILWAVATERTADDKGISVEKISSQRREWRRNILQNQGIRTIMRR